MGKQENKIKPEVDLNYSVKIQALDNAIGNIDSNFGNIVREKAYNPYVASQPYTFNPNSTTDQNKNYERYYSHPSFEKLGYNPWSDNEALYNEKGSKGGDVWRATKAAFKLMGTGFMSPLRSYADLFTGNAFSPDEKSAKEMNYYNTVGSSTKGGITGFSSNLISNSGYTFGLIGEMIMETAAITALTAETGGATGGLLVGRIGKFGRDFGRVSEAINGINNTVNSLKEYNIAKAVWEGVKTTGKFINPLENTTNAIYRAVNYKGVVDLAKGSKTAAAFFRDLQFANLALSESKLEGATAQKDTEEQLISEYRNAHNGKEPSYEELLNIKETASDVGVKTIALNIPTIFLTNKITFAPLMSVFTKPSEYVLRNGVRFIEKEGEGLVEANLRNKLIVSLKPKNLPKAFLGYFGRNLSEGFQESTQEVISGGAIDYYKNLYYHPAKQGLDTAQGENQTNGVWDAISKNVTDQFSGKGFETFASGFLMGGLIGVAGAPIRLLHSGYKEYKQKRSEYTTQTLNKLNEMYKDPLKFFAPNIINFVNGSEAVSGQNNATRKGDQKEWLDLENSNLTSNVMTALDSNTYDIFLDKLRTIKTMDPKAINEAYGVDGQEALSKIDKVISRAEKVKENYEKWNERYENPFNPGFYTKDSPDYNRAALGYVAWENAKKLAIFNESSFGRNVDRIQGISNDILQTGEFKNLNSNDISLLYSPGTIQNEIKLLDNEIEVLDNSEIPGDRNTLLQTKTKKKRLEDFYEKLQGYYVGQTFDKLDKNQQEAFGEFKKTNRKQLEKSYQDYIGHLATTQVNVVPVTALDLQNSFQKLLDLHSLKQDNTYYTQAINIMADPEGFIVQHERLNKALSDLYDSRKNVLKTAIEETHKKIEDNAILNVLHIRGFVLSPDDTEKLLKDKTIPKEFYDINAKQIVDERNPVKYNELIDIVRNYVEVSKPEEEIEKVEINTDAEKVLRDIWNKIGNTAGRSALEDGWAESFEYLPQTIPVGGEEYAAHGMGKSSFGTSLADLFNLFRNGIDPSRGGGQLYTAPLVTKESGIGVGTGTAGGNAYADGAFILVAKKGKTGIKSIEDVGGILVNSGLTDINSNIVPELKKAFPGLVIDNYKNAKNFVEQLNDQSNTVIEVVEDKTNSENVVEETKSNLSVDLISKFNAVKTGEQLKALEDEMTELIAKTTLEERISAGLNSKDIDNRLKQKAVELNSNIIIENLKVGDVLSGAGVYNGENLIIISKNNNEIKVRNIMDKNDTKTIQDDDLKSVIKYKYSDNMSIEKTKATSDEINKSKENVNKQEKLIDNKELLEEILEEAYKDEKKFQEDFENELGCK